MGNLVLKKILPIHEDVRGKWVPNYEYGEEAFSGGKLILIDMDGDVLPKFVNSDAIKNILLEIILFSN